MNSESRSGQSKVPRFGNYSDQNLYKLLRQGEATARTVGTEISV